eukprot:scaffold10260_cov266-Chaetoceros_neogracile.AAC.58
MRKRISGSNGTRTVRFSVDDDRNSQASSHSFSSDNEDYSDANSNSVDSDNNQSSSSSSDSCSYDSLGEDEEGQGIAGDLLENGMNGKTIKSRLNHGNSNDASSSYNHSQSRGPSQIGLPIFTMRNRRRGSSPPRGTNNVSTRARTIQQRSSQQSSRRQRSSSSDNKKNGASHSVQSVVSLYLSSAKIIISKKSSAFLLFSILIWLYVQFHFATDVHAQFDSYTNRGQAQGQHDVPESVKLQQKLDQIRERREQSALRSLGSAAGNYVFGNGKKKKPSKDGYGSAADVLPPSCMLKDWQKENHPFCNEIHSLDLRRIYVPDRDHYHGGGDGDHPSLRSQGYLGSGLWRQVWKVIPSQGEEAVLKIMKTDHPVSPRNFDRHRRDALVMEKLTNSERVVSIYAFCGNTVLTEYAGMTLDDFLFKEGFQKEPWSNRYDLTRTDGMGKVQLALDVMQGVEDLHQNDILHADIQVKQFLLDPVEGVKVNDFNRCRLLPTDDKTGKLCNVKIPSAPGAQRSPEEYELQRIGTKADIFSTANILFGILTGAKPWGEEAMKKDIRKNIIKGRKPEIDEKHLVEGTVDAKLAKIILKAYEFKPKDRWSATRILEELRSCLPIGEVEISKPRLDQ